MKKSSSKSYYPSRLEHDRRGAIMVWVIAIALVLIVFFIGRNIINREKVDPYKISPEEIRAHYGITTCLLSSQLDDLSRAYKNPDGTLDRNKIFSEIDKFCTPENTFFGNLKEFISGMFNAVGYGEIVYGEYILTYPIAIIFAAILSTLFAWALLSIKHLLIPAAPPATDFVLDTKKKLYSFAGATAIILLVIFLLLALVPLFGLFKPIMGPLFSDYGYKMQISSTKLLDSVGSLFSKKPEGTVWLTLKSIFWLPFLKGIGTAAYIAFFFILYVFSEAVVSLIKRIIHLFYGIKGQIHLEKLNLGIREAIMGAKLQRETARAAASD